LFVNTDILAVLHEQFYYFLLESSIKQNDTSSRNY